MFARFFPYLGILLAILVAALAASVTRVEIYRAPAVPSASSTLSVVPSLTPIPLSLGSLFPQPSASASSSADVHSAHTEATTIPEPPTQKVPPPAAPAHAKQSVQSAPATSTPQSVPPPLPSSGSASLDASALALRGALVNIICNAPAGGNIHSILGSGVVVDPKGIILTNAHVAQYFLLSDRGVSCSMRTGSPARDAYRASLIYIPSSWLSQNAALITQSMPSGDGQHDYALLAVTSTASGDPLPASFGSIPLASAPPSPGEPVVIGTYGAQFLSASQIESSLFPTLVFGSIKVIYTYGTNSVDVVSLGGSVAAQEGSSGGGVTDASGSLIATIVTSTVEGDTASRNVNAITAAYIRADYARANGTPLDLLLSEPTDRAVSDFAPRMPQLESLLTAQLDAR